MRIIFNEQDLVDSVCVFVAQRYRERPDNLAVELFFEEGRGFSAVAFERHHNHRYQVFEQDLIDAIAVFLAEYHRFDPHGLAIELFFDTNEGFSAVVDRH